MIQMCERNLPGQRLRSAAAVVSAPTPSRSAKRDRGRESARAGALHASHGKERGWLATRSWVQRVKVTSLCCPSRMEGHVWPRAANVASGLGVRRVPPVSEPQSHRPSL